MTFSRILELTLNIIKLFFHMTKSQEKNSREKVREISWEWKELLRLNKKHFSSFSKGFQLNLEYKSIHQLDFVTYKRTVFNDLNKRHIQKLLLKDLEIEKCTWEIFSFDYQMWKIFYIKRKRKVFSFLEIISVLE